MSRERITLGKQGEAYVARYLMAHGFHICLLNYSTRQGEIDIIAKKEDILAFVEVKIRRTSYFPLSELIPPLKQKKIIKTALSYIANHKIRNMAYRFDVALLEISPLGEYTITYLENAFTAPHAGTTMLI